MLVTLISKKEIYSITLPIKKEGQYWIKNLISIEGIANQWVLKSNRKVSIIDYTAGKQEVPRMALEAMQVYHIRKEENGEDLIIFTEPITEDRKKYQKLTIIRDAKIPIGRNDANEIAFKNRFASSQHAELIYQNKKWYIQDLGSTNGTFVNNKRIKEASLNLGDVIYIMGFKIVIGIDFIAFNNPDGQVKINSSSFKNYEPKKYKKFLDDINYYEDFEDEEIEEEYFYRSPRFKREINTIDINLASAPKRQNGDEMPASLTIGPSVTMGMGSMLSAVTSLATMQIPAAITSTGMLLGTLFWPNATRKYQKKLRDEEEVKRQELYTQYLNKIKDTINKEIENQKAILEENYISSNECARIISNIDRTLWNRTPEQNDFLKLRVGKGDIELNHSLHYQKKDFEMDTDNLDEQMQKLAELPKLIKDAPIIISFLQSYMSGIIGDRQKVIEFVKGLVLQMMTYYSYDELKMVFIYDKEEEEEFDFAKWLPHSWNNQKSIRFIATDSSEVKEISAYLEKEMNKRIELNEEDLKEEMPYYMIFALSKDLCIRSDLVKKLTNIKHNINMSLITCFNELRYIPKECSTVIELNNYTAKIYDKYDTSGNHIEFKPDISIKEDLTMLSTKLANIKLDLDLDGESYSLPNMLTFLEMYGVGKVEHLNALSRWKENDPTRTLEAPIGVNTFGNTFYLDLHEKFHGPHGLIAGMTGSGKSEFIMTYILSLAINYHPDEVAFVLIDYKGGGMAKAFENLPHVAGIITNLDGAEVNRSLVSIQSELTRRQNIFSKTSKEIGVSNIDIYKYQKLYRDGVVSEPLQHLFIISDEFAELKSQQKEFMDQLTSAARIGRSLGVHLILATQKPSGVVDDQIWSNARAKLCLKVQDRQDSMDMLKRPEAAEIRETGRFYLQVGYNESFDLGQSAWAGATYIPQDKVLKQKDESIQIVDKIGRIVKEGKADKNQIVESNPKKQLDAITEYIRKIANEENIKVRPLWLPKIPNKIYLQDLQEKYNYEKVKNEIAPLIGEYDDPENQRQMPLYLPLSQNGNLALFGMAGSGKNMFITTMIYSLLQDYNSSDIGLYILDFDAETLKVFEKAPHVGDVVFSNEKEKVINLFKLLLGQLEIRKKILADFGGDIDFYNKNADNKIQKLFTIINNYEVFREIYEDQEEELEKLSREGMKYGIYFIVVASSTNGIRYKVLNNFKQQVALQLKDENDYSSVVGRTDGLYPSKYQGRGLIKLDKIYEFQTAGITKDENQLAILKEFCENLETTNSINTKKIPVLPSKVDMDIIKDYIEKDLKTIPIGVETDSLEINNYDFSNSYINLVLSRDADTYNEFVKSIIKIYSRSESYLTVLLDVNNDLKNSDRCKKTGCNLNECCDIIKTLYRLTVIRNNTYITAKEEGKELPEFQKLIVFINGISELLSSLDEYHKEMLNLVLEKGQKTYNMNFVISEINKKISTVSYNNWYKQKVNTSNGIWVGTGITDQFSINISSQNSEMRKDISNEYGYVVNKGKTTKIKLLNLGDE